MADGQIGTLLALLDEAFEDDAEHSLLGNMRHVDDAIWDQAPPGGSRPISELFLHAATASYAYDDAAFRGQPGRWDHWEQDAPRERLAALEWAREGHRRLRDQSQPSTTQISTESATRTGAADVRHVGSSSSPQSTTSTTRARSTTRGR